MRQRRRYSPPRPRQPRPQRGWLTAPGCLSLPRAPWSRGRGSSGRRGRLRRCRSRRRWQRRARPPPTRRASGSARARGARGRLRGRWQSRLQPSRPCRASRLHRLPRRCGQHSRPVQRARRHGHRPHCPRSPSCVPRRGAPAVRPPRPRSSWRGRTGGLLRQPPSSRRVPGSSESRFAYRSCAASPRWGRAWRWRA